MINFGVIYYIFWQKIRKTSLAEQQPQNVTWRSLPLTFVLIPFFEFRWPKEWQFDLFWNPSFFESPCTLGWFSIIPKKPFLAFLKTNKSVFFQKTQETLAIPVELQAGNHLCLISLFWWIFCSLVQLYPFKLIFKNCFLHEQFFDNRILVNSFTTKEINVKQTNVFFQLFVLKRLIKIITKITIIQIPTLQKVFMYPPLKAPLNRTLGPRVQGRNWPMQLFDLFPL